MNDKTIQSPPKKKVKDSVPFMNGSYDFSTVGSNGEIVYSERELSITLGLPAETKEELQVIYSKVLRWMVDTGKSQLIFDVMKDYYFLAEVESASTLSEVMENGTLKLTLIADPFKKSVDYVGSDIWDTFNFEEDYAQFNTYQINGSSTIKLYNPARVVRPLINCTSAMTMIKNGVTYNLSAGDNNVYGFNLDTGENVLTINGNGTIKFLFRKESI